MVTPACEFTTIVFFDVGTDKKQKQPANKKIGIMELCLVAIRCQHFLNLEGGEPRILRKLVMPLNPQPKQVGRKSQQLIDGKV